MKNVIKVIECRKNKIIENNLNIINYVDHENIECVCNTCNYTIVDNYRNLSYKKFKCKYCNLISKSILIRNADITLRKIYENNKIELECENGHIYIQDRRNLLAGKRCKKCYDDNKILSFDEIFNRFKNIHGDYYEYDFKDFKNLHSKIIIKCGKGHSFSQKVSNHLQGKGCPICRESLGERTIRIFLENNNIYYIRQKKFRDCKYIKELPFDFYIPKYNTCIEYDGVQHFESVSVFGGDNEFEKTKVKDKIKDEYCIKNNIHLLRISYSDDILNKLELFVQESIILKS